MKPASPKIFVAEDRGVNGAGLASSLSGPRQLLIVLPDELRREILETRALFQDTCPATFAAAAPVLASIYSFWYDELERIAGELLAPLNCDARPVHVETFASWSLTTFVADFPIGEKVAPATLRRLILILDNALDGKLSFLDARPEPVTYRTARRWTRRWWRDLFRAAWIRYCCPGQRIADGGSACAREAAQPDHLSKDSAPSAASLDPLTHNPT